MNLREGIERVKLFKKIIGKKIRDWFFRISKFYLRLRGRDPDLWNKINQLRSQRRRFRGVIREYRLRLRETRAQKEKVIQLEALVKELEDKNTELDAHIKELIQQISEMESDFCEFKERWIDYLKSSSDWRTKSEALKTFICYLEEVIPLSDEEKKSISQTRELSRKSKVERWGKGGLKALFTQVGLIKKEETNTKPVED